MDTRANKTKPAEKRKRDESGEPSNVPKKVQKLSDERRLHKNEQERQHRLRKKNRFAELETENLLLKSKLSLFSKKDDLNTQIIVNLKNQLRIRAQLAGEPMDVEIKPELKKFV